MIFTNIWDLLKDMHDSGSTDIICADKIDGIHGFGWVCQQTEKVWAIRIVDVIKTGNKAAIKDIKILQIYMSSPDGRKKIVEMLGLLFCDVENKDENKDENNNANL